MRDIKLKNSAPEKVKHEVKGTKTKKTFAFKSKKPNPANKNALKSTAPAKVKVKEKKTFTFKSNKSSPVKSKAQKQAKGNVTWRTTHGGEQYPQHRPIQFSETWIELKRLRWTHIRIAICTLLLLATILQIACTVSPSWLNIQSVHHQGIWRVCTQTKNGIECFRYQTIPNYFKPLQIMMVISSVLCLSALVYFYYMLKKKTNPAFLLTIILATAGVLSIISLVLFTDKNMKTVTSTKMTFGWSYFSGWGSVMFTLITAGLALYEERMTKRDDFK